jgi:hypothetical protein
MALVDLKSDLTWYGTPPSVNYLSDKESGATGFTDSVNATQYIGVANDSYTYPVTVRGGRLMQPNSAAKFPGPQNFFDNRKSGARGFTLDMDKLPREDKSEFLGIYNSSYSYPNSVLSGRLMQPAGTSRSGPIVRFRGPQNFFDDKLSGAKGFTLNMDKLPRTDKSEFIGIRGLNYRYPTTLVTGDRLMKPRLSTSFPGPQNFFADVNATGFTENMWKPGQSKKPSQFVGINGDTYTYPSNLVDKFNDLNIVDDSYNTTYIQQPYVVRGLQRKGEANSKPQYWGFGSKSGFDDGLIRGGAVTVADRVVADTKRIAKFLASPKGLLWSIKQFGLGLTNPKVEANPIAPILQTRIHTGVTSLLSVAGTPFGLHFTTHGLPFANELSSYGKVQLAKRFTWNSPVGGNRLINLRTQVFGKVISIPPIFGLPGANIKIPGIPVGAPIPTLSGIAGPQSVYGVGVTSINRATDSLNDAFQNAKTSNYPFKYGSFIDFAGFKSYAPLLRANTKNDFDTKRQNELEPRDAPGVDNTVGKWAGLKTKLERDLSLQETSIKTRTPGNDRKADISTSNAKDSVYGERNTVNDYVTLAYSKIPKKSSTSKLNDFRSTIFENTISTLNDSQRSQLGKGTLPNNEYYNSNNLQNKYGFGDLGRVGADRTNPDSFGKRSTNEEIKAADYKGGASPLLDNNNGFRGDKINAINIQSFDENDDPYKKTDTNDLIKFFFEDGQKGTNVMIFRAILTGLTDSFSPGWDKIDIMGRPDGAYIYTSFERTVSFNFTVAALSRGEMIPIWRKLNYLSTYTMPNLQYSSTTKGRVSGPFMRMTLGDMYNRVPGFISSLSYTVPDESSWDIAEGNNGKQLPMIVEVGISYTVIHDYRPQLKGKAFSIYDGTDNWLVDSETL